MFGGPRHVLGTSSSFISGCSWEHFALEATLHLAPCGLPWSSLLRLFRAQTLHPKQGQWLSSPTADAFSNAALRYRGAGILAA